MKIQGEVLPFLDGSKFSNGLSWGLGPSRTVVPTRWDVLKEICTGRNVLHVGFADHLPLIETKRAEGRWLHGQLIEIASRCCGIDINGEAVEFVRDKLGISDVWIADVTKELPDNIKSNNWDVILLGEVLEHVDDPGAFLRAIKRNISTTAANLVVTVPNATAFLSLRASFRNEECINTDHRYWFSPYTIAKLLKETGWEPQEFELCEPSVWWREPRLIARPVSMLHRVLLSLCPSMSEMVVMQATKALE